MEAKGCSPCATELQGRKDLDLRVDESSLGLGDTPFLPPLEFFR